MRFLSIFILAGFLLINSSLLISSENSQTGNNENKITLSSGNGLTGHYYQNILKDSTGMISFTGLTEQFSRIDTVINFWNGDPYYRFEPVSGWGDKYSIEWKGYIYIEQAGTYGFGTISDDGSQILIDSVLIVDNSELQWYDWEDNISEGDTSGTPFPPLSLDTGFHAISVRFFENAYYDGIKLWWFKADTAQSDIPYYGTDFHGVAPTYNPQTNWEIVPKRVLYTEKDTSATGISSREIVHLPATLQLQQNYPNPFNTQTVFEFFLSEVTDITLTLYNASGERISTLLSGRFSQGSHRYIWDAGNLASGIYFYRLDDGRISLVKKALLLK